MIRWANCSMAMASATDSIHLDRTAWMRVVDAVDADASNRASLSVRAEGAEFAAVRTVPSDRGEGGSVVRHGESGVICFRVYPMVRGNPTNVLKNKLICVWRVLRRRFVVSRKCLLMDVG